MFPIMYQTHSTFAPTKISTIEHVYVIYADSFPFITTNYITMHIHVCINHLQIVVEI